MSWALGRIPDLAGRVAPVTGADAGIGFETARALARRRAETVLACRDLDKTATAVARIRAEIQEAKLHSLSRVVVVSRLAAHFGHIDFDDIQWHRRRFAKWPAYVQSKLANLVFAPEFARRLAAAESVVSATDSSAHNGSYWGPSDWMGLRGSQAKLRIPARDLNPASADRLWSVGEAWSGVSIPLPAGLAGDAANA